MTPFYKLTPDEVQGITTTLSRAEILVYYWLKSCDPYGHTTEIHTQDVADALKITRRTVQRSLIGLDEKGLIELEVSTFRFRWKGAIDLSRGDRNVAKTTRSICREAIEMSPQAIEMSPKAIDLSPTTAETLSQSGTQIAKNNKEFKDLSLSESAIVEQDDLPLEPEPSEGDLLAFVIEQVGRGANNPRAYGLKVLKDDRQYWIQQFIESKKSRLQPTARNVPPPLPIDALPFAAYPPPSPPPPPSAPPIQVDSRLAILARAASLVELGRSPNMAVFARKKLQSLIKEHDITPEELKGYLGQKNPNSVDVEVCHPMQVPQLAGVDVDQEYHDRMVAAQWARFQEGEAW